MVAMQRSSAHVAAATHFGIDLVRRSDPSPHPRAAIAIPMLAIRRGEEGCEPCCAAGLARHVAEETGGGI